MHCKECGNDKFRVKTKAITEYHDATLVVHGMLTHRYRVTGKDAGGSFYVEDAELECLKCHNKVKVVEQGCLLRSDMEELLIEIERLL